MNEVIEEWITIPNSNRDYHVSSTGKIKSTKSKKERILKPYFDKSGYEIVSFYIGKEHFRFKIHRLVAILFLTNEHDYPQINHKNGIKTDNSKENLEWCTAKQNMKHARDTGLNKPHLGIQNGRSILTENDVLTIRSLYSTKTPTEIHQQFQEISKATIHKIVYNKTWKHLLQDAKN